MGSIRDSNAAGRVIDILEPDLESIRRQDISQSVRPFDAGDLVLCEEIVDAEAERFDIAADPVEVEMVERQRGLVGPEDRVLFEQDEGRAGDGFDDAETLGNTFHELGLAGPQVADEADGGPTGEPLGEAAAEFDRSFGGGRDVLHGFGMLMA